MTLRPLTKYDADFLLELKNYDETIRFAISTKSKIKKKNHYKYLRDNSRYFSMICTENRESIGVVRVQDNEISIWIDRKFWGLGVATKVIKQIAKKGMTAKIVEGNIRSMRAFIKAGFVPVSYNSTANYSTNYYTFKK